MPERPHDHVLETVSRRKFEINLGEWVARQTGSDDYGIDMTVEIFRDNSATGDSFAVQLKAKRNAGDTPRAIVKRTSINYWRAQAVPTLVVMWDEATDSLFYRWVHDFPFDSHPDTATRTIPLARRWDDTTLSELDTEVRAFRAARLLSHHLPLEVLVEGVTFDGVDAGVLKSEILTLLTGINDVRVRFSDASIPFVWVAIESRTIRVGISGAEAVELRYPSSPRFGSEIVAADVIARIAYMLSDFGQMDSLVVELLARASGRSEFVLSPSRLSDTTAVLARAGRAEAVADLMQRTLAGRPEMRAQALVGIIAAVDSVPLAQLQRIAHLLVERGVEPTTGEDIYNAANLLRDADSAEALALYDRAAARDSTYWRRSYWWRERAVLELRVGDPEVAKSNLQSAVDMGDDLARMFLAEAIAREGEYEAALRLLDEATWSEDLALARYRLLRRALRHIVQDWGISTQSRRATPEPPPNGATDDEALRNADDAVRVDAFNSWAHWARCPILARRGEDQIPSLTVAAIALPAFPPTWDELIRQAWTHGEWALVEDALWCAREFCGDSFQRHLLTDTFMDAETRRSLTVLFEAQPGPPLQEFQVRLIQRGAVTEQRLASGAPPSRRAPR